MSSGQLSLEVEGGGDCGKHIFTAVVEWGLRSIQFQTIFVCPGRERETLSLREKEKERRLSFR